MEPEKRPFHHEGLGARLETRLTSLPAWVLPAVVFVVAAALRAWTLFDERAGNPLFRIAILDDQAYLRLAGEAQTGASAGKSWFLAPLYPWVLAGAARGAVPGMALAGWLAALVGSLTAAATAIAARAIHSGTAGWIAGLLYACAGVFVFDEVLPGQEPLLCLLHALALLVATVYFARGAAPWIAGAFGAVVGVAMLGRATSGVLLVAFAVVALRRIAPRRAASGVLLAVLGTLIVLVPAAFRNAAICGDFTPFPWSGGPNLFMANGPDSRKYVAFASAELGMNPEAMERRAVEIAETAEARKLRPSEVSSYWTRRAWDERGDAGGFAAHIGTKALLFWNSDEFGSTHYVPIEREGAAWLRLVPVTSWWILATGLAGWWIARSRAPVLDVAFGVIVLTWAALVVFFPVSRYRLPAASLAVTCAAAGLAEVVLAAMPRRTLVTAGLIVGCAFGVSRLHLREAGRSNDWNNVAGAFEVEGDRIAAVATPRRSLAEEPDDGPVLVRLARLVLDDSRPEEALELLRRAERDARTQWIAGIPAVYVYVLLGRADLAEQAGAILVDKPMPDARLRAELLANLALAADAVGHHAIARDRLRAAEAIDPSSSAVERARRNIAE